MIELLRQALKLAEEVSGANLLTIVVLIIFLGGYAAIKFAKKQAFAAKKCGVQKQLLVGYIQSTDKSKPSDAIAKANKMTMETMDDRVH